jgi:hypothetical protein
LSGATALAQQPPAASASTPTTSASVSQDCRKPVARHDHLADKGITRPMSGPCAGKPSASATKAKARPVHDHAKFHKNQ